MDAAERLRQGPDRTLLSFMEDPVVVLDARGTVMYLNPSFALRFQTSREQAVGRSIKEALPERLCEPLVERLGMLEPGCSAHNFWMGGDRESFRVSMACINVADRVGGAVVTIWDATRESRMKKRNVELFRAMLDDMRLPLAELQSLLGRLKDIRAPEKSGIEAQSEALEESLSRLDDFTEVLFGEVRTEKVPFFPSRLLSLARKSLRPLAANRKVHLEDGSSRDLPGLIGDPALLNRVLGLMVDYMIKSVPRNEMVIISAEILTGKDGNPELSYSVTGTGVLNLEGELAEGESSVLTIFGGLPDERKRLMLRILLARRLVTIMKGRVAVASHESVGTTLSARIPVQIHFSQ